MPGFYLSSEDGKPIKDTNPLPVQLAGASSGSAVNVDIIGNTAGLATEAKQDDIIQAIESLAGGDSSSEIFTGSMSVTTSADALPDQAIAEVLLQNDPDSTEDIFLGDDTTQNFRLKPGEWISMRITNLNLIYAKTSANTATLQYFARGPAGIPGGGSSPVPVQLTGSIGKELIRVVKSGALAPGTTDVLLDTDYPTVIDYIEWAQNHATYGELQIQVRMPNGTLQYLRTLTPFGSSTGVRWRPSDFQTNGFPRLVDVITYSDGNYKFATNELFSRLSFPHGIVISRVNTHAEYADLDMAVLILGRRVS